MDGSEKLKDDLYSDLMINGEALDVHDYTGSSDRRARDVLMDSTGTYDSHGVLEDITEQRPNDRKLAEKLTFLRQMETAVKNTEQKLFDIARNILGNEDMAAVRAVSLVGIGTGSGSTVTGEAAKVLADASLIIGSPYDLKLALEVVERETGVSSLGKKRTAALVNAEDIADCIKKDPGGDVAVVFTGEVGFYDTARELIDRLGAYSVRIIPGISVLGIFAAKLRLSCESGPILEFNDSSSPVIYAVSTREYVFLILNGEEVVRKLSARLLDFGLRDVTVTVGYNLGTAREEIVSGKPLEFMKASGDGIFPAVIRNKHPLPARVTGKVDDRYFVQGQVPPYSTAVRSVITNELQLEEDSIIYDIGAGVGALSVECALMCPHGRVFSIEKKQENLALLRANRRQFLAENMEIVLGAAPAAIENIIPPSRVVIEGRIPLLGEIVRTVFKKNPYCRIVVCVMDLESLTKAMETLKSFPYTDTRMVSVRTSRTQMAEENNAFESDREVYILSTQRRSAAPVFSEKEFDLDDIGNNETGIVRGVVAKVWKPGRL